MSRSRIRINHREVEKFMKAKEMQDRMQDHADEIASRAGPGFEASTWQGDSRVIGSVRAESYRARRAQSNNRVLYKAIKRRDS